MRKLLLLFVLLLGTQAYAQSPLCASTSTSFCCEYVASITINGQTYQGNTGFTGPGYYDYTGTPVPPINAGDQITISYTVTTNGPYHQYFKFWFDFNGNGLLSDPGELIHQYDEIISSTTKTFTNTFTVPTTVYNGQVYMRFIMVYSSSPTLCGNYPYGNTFDFSTTITGATDPFNHQGYFLGAEEEGVAGIPVKLYEKPKSGSTYTLASTVLTDADGFYKLTSQKDSLSYDFKMVVDALTVADPSIADAAQFNQKIFDQDFSGVDYYRMDSNSNAALTMTDVYLIFAKIAGLSWLPGVNPYFILNPTEWSQVKNSNTDLRTTYPGIQSIEINNLRTGDSTNFHLLRKGHYN